jgi:hypothetical protein
LLRGCDVFVSPAKPTARALIYARHFSNNPPARCDWQSDNSERFALAVDGMDFIVYNVPLNRCKLLKFKAEIRKNLVSFAVTVGLT